MGAIYKITNTLNGKAYIGQTTQPAKRIAYHMNGHGNRLIKNAITKYGRDVFTYEILYDGIIPELLSRYEVDAIKKYGTLAPKGYNLTTGGEFAKELSAETRQKISEAHKGKKMSADACRKISELHKGRPHSAEHRRKVSESKIGSKNAFFGKTHTPETRHKISDAGKGNTRAKGNTHWVGRKHTVESRRKMSESRKRYWAEKKAKRQQRENPR